MKAVARGTVVVELQKIDIFADMGAYIFARDFLGNGATAFASTA